MTILLVAAILVFLIVAHELGHFFVAKLFRVRVEEFGIGYPPRAFSLGTWSGTEYTLNWLPFGGFVRIFGEDDPEGGKGSFAGAPRWAQALILVAGVAANALAAYLLFAAAFAAGLPHAVEPGTPHAERAQLIVASVLPRSPAALGELSVGDRIVSVADETGARAELDPENVAAFVETRGGEALFVTYERSGEQRVEELRPAHAVIPGEESRPAVGFGLMLVSDERMGLFESLREAGPRTLGAFALVGNGLWEILMNALRGSGSLDDVVGPVGLYGVVGDAAKHGSAQVLALAAFISVNLVIINLLPIPALDGGRLLMVGYEAAARRPPPQVVFRALNMLGIVLIALLMLAITFNDIARLLT